MTFTASLAALISVGLALLGGPASATATPAGAVRAPEGPAGDAFYVPPDPLPPGEPGDVIWQRKKADSGRATSYLILYRSTDALGAPIAVSGTVVVPKDRRTRLMPVVGVAPPTTGLADRCAASRDDPIAVSANPADLLQHGVALATTDYEGLGTPGRHTYIVGRSAGHAVIDVVRAATRLGVGLSARAPVGFWGYSQGGAAALWAGELARTYGRELRVRGIVAGGPPADLTAVKAALNGGLGFGALAAASYGLDAAYPELDLERYLNAAGRQMLEDLQSMCTFDLFLAFPFKRITDYTTSDPTLTPAWQARLRENSLGGSPPRVPVFMYHAIFDEILPFAQAEALRNRYCAAGVKVTWSPQLGEHLTAQFTGMAPGVAYMTDRLRGKPAGSTC
jgi:hypothetical protein